MLNLVDIWNSELSGYTADEVEDLIERKKIPTHKYKYTKRQTLTRKGGIWEVQYI